MIDKNKIISLIDEVLAEEMFLVDISISSANSINVQIDSFDNITIDDCIKVSRQIEGNLDREAEDFELSVSSAGLGQPFKILKQYQKNIGKEVEVICLGGEKLSGTLIDVTDNEVLLETKSREKLEGHKKKQLVVKTHTIEFEKIKETKNIISFK